MSCQLITKASGDVRPITVDFSGFAELEAGATVASVDATSVDPTGLTLGSTSTTASTATVSVSSGTQGISYKVRIRIITSASHKLTGEATVDIV